MLKNDKKFRVGQIGLTLIKQPIDLKENYLNLEYSARQYWHKIVNAEPSHIWLRQMVKQVANEIRA